ncbi:hypothetical protein [Streptomyces sp. NRRL B-3648]|uniref:hypothetical protein n=1 Tax=Streptomyces sp. NRRL B-3648 TaxID=1519493 RepID=UPI0006C1F33C|nr:hypothetical protein [Streptomyces sp. NRRL B-3648]KOX11126.1 hypothetical protein ADL04_02275 [Streptomyces sp. NRRL B-3648]
MAMTQALIPALEDAHHAHAAARDRLRADAEAAPPGPHRQLLQRQADDMQDRLHSIELHLSGLRPRGLLGGVTDMARFAARTTVRTATLPLTLGQKAVTGVMRGRGTVDERQLLRNTEDEYAAAARALATSQAGEVLADQAQDRVTLDLFLEMRDHDRELLDQLEDSLARQARAVASAGDGFRVEQTANGGLAHRAARPLLAVADLLRHAAHPGQPPGPPGEPAGERTEVTAAAEQVQGAVSSEESLPIIGFSQLSVEEIEQRLPLLSESDLQVLQGYERTHAQRKGVLEAIERLSSHPY